MFMAAHVLYAAAFGLLVRRIGKPFVNAGFWIAIGVALAAMIGLLVLYSRSSTHRIDRLVLALAYCLVIGSMGMAVGSYAFAKGGWAFLAALGALSFMVSDMMIGVSVVGGVKIPYYSELVWTFYPIGQILLAVFQ